VLTSKIWITFGFVVSMIETTSEEIEIEF